MTTISATFTLEKDTKRTRKFQEQAGKEGPICNLIYVQKEALRRLTGGDLPQAIKVTIEVA
jgi:hypothetical protein